MRSLMGIVVWTVTLLSSAMARADNWTSAARLSEAREGLGRSGSRTVASSHSAGIEGRRSSRSPRSTILQPMLGSQSRRCPHHALVRHPDSLRTAAFSSRAAGWRGELRFVCCL